MTYFWAKGVALRMWVADDGRPKAFMWEHQRYQVSVITDQWRIDEGWWIVRIWREYYEILTDTGLMVVIYKNLLTGQWFLQWMFD